MNGIVKFIGNIGNFFGDLWDVITEVIDVFKSLYDIVLSFISFFPSPFREMTIFTVGIIFILVVWRLKR